MGYMAFVSSRLGTRLQACLRGGWEIYGLFILKKDLHSVGKNEGIAENISILTSITILMEVRFRTKLVYLLVSIFIKHHRKSRLT